MLREEAAADLRVGVLVDSTARLDGEVAPDLWRGAEVEFIDFATCGLEPIVCILTRDPDGHHMTCATQSVSNHV